MKKYTGFILAAVIALLSAAYPAQAIASSYSYAVFTLDDRYLAIHEKADDSSDVVATLSSGALCRVLEEEDEWTKVFSGGYVGYVSTTKLTLDVDKLSIGGIYDGVAFYEDTTVYSEPDISSSVIAERKSGATEPVAGDGGDVNGWTKISVVINSSGDTMDGWVKNSCVARTNVMKDAEPYFADWESSTVSDAEEALAKADAARESADSALNQKENESSSQSSSSSQVLVTGNGVLNKTVGTVIGPSGKETYYNLDMSGVVSIMRNLGYSEEEYPYWVREDGCKMLGDYIMVAANLSVRPRGTLVETSLGTGIVADTGDFAYTNIYQLDLAVNW